MRENENAALSRIKRDFDAELQRAALDQTALAARDALETMRQQMAAAGLGRLGFALGAGSDKAKGGAVHHRAGGGWSVSGWVFIRSQSPRTVGSIISYTEGASILPRRGRWLWIATDEVSRLVGLPLPGTRGSKKSANFRLEPRLWDRTYGRRFGPLEIIKGINGYPLMILKTGTVSLSGKRGTLKPLTKAGKVPKGQVAKEFIVAFYSIPNTSRAARIDPRMIAAQAAQRGGERAAASFNAGRN